MFTDLTNDKPFLKIGFQGFAGDGKTFTAALLAIALHKKIKSTKPVAIFDTEHAAKALKPLFEQNKVKAQSTKERSLAALSKAIKWCEDGGSDILIIDSLTHVWEHFLNAYMTQKNRRQLQFQDWGILKPKWKNEFSTPFVDAKVHILFTGRAGYTYDNELIKDEETGKERREIHKSGIKMKVENETAYEPDILVLMESVENLLTDPKTIYRTATILKDRTNTIDGQTLNWDGKKKGVDFEDFKPAINALLDGKVVERTEERIEDNFSTAENKQYYAAKERERLIADLEGLFSLMGLGTGAKDKQFKTYCLKNVFGVLSVEALETLQPDFIQIGVNVMKKFADDYGVYLKNCADGNTAAEANVVAELLKDAIKEFQPQELPFN